ncbi:MAG: fused MFS/spermidine synthase [Nitrospiria bacterium]
MFLIIPILFFLSGFTALIYQMVWMRELILVFGASMFAISTLLTAFMGGLALGSWFFGKRAEGYANPLQVYALLEWGIGAYAFLVPVLFTALLPIYRLLSDWFDFSFYVFSLVRFVLAVAILLIPTALMGGTLPVLAQRYKNQKTVGRGVGLLYAFNTFGAVAGVLGAGFILLPALGLQKSVFIAAGLNALIGLTATLLGKAPAPPIPAPGEKQKTKKQVRVSRLSEHDMFRRQILLTVFAVSGFSAMIYEVIWTRILTLILGSTVYSYATMLGTYLLGLALGSFIFSLLLKQFKRPLLLLTLVQGGIALSCFAGAFLFPLLPSIFLKIMEVFHTWKWVRDTAKFILSAAVMLMPTLLMGGVFPLVIHLLTARGDEDRPLGFIVGKAYAVNTLGTIFGSFTVGFIMLPTLGIQKSLHLAIAINAFLCLVLWFLFSQREAKQSPARLRSKGWATGGVFVFLLIVSFSSPTWDPLMMSSDLFGQQAKLNLLYYKEGISSTVTVVQHPTLAKEPHLTLAIDGKANASTTGDMKTQLLVAHLPMLLVPQAPKEVMLIGHGSGITTGSMITHPVSKLVTLELEPAVIEGSRFFDRFSGHVLDDPRVTLAMDDARNYLLRTDDRYDVIVSEPSHPWRSGSAKLFTREFFQLGKDHLKPGGIFSQWIHFYGIRAQELKSVIRTFNTVFEQVMIFFTDAGDLIMLGSETPFRIDREEISRRIAEGAVAEDLARANIYSVFDLWSHFMIGPNEIDRYAGNAVLNTDDFTLVEFQTPKSLFEDTMSVHIAELRGAAAAGGNYLFGDEESSAVRAEGYFNIAKGFIRNDKLKEAEETIIKGLRLHPSVRGEWLLGRLRLIQGGREAAEQSWHTALTHDPLHEESLLSLGQLYQSQGAYQKAGTYLSKIKKESLVGVKSAYYRGVDLYFRGEYEAARDALQIGELFSKPYVHYYQHLVHDKLGQEAASKQALGDFIVALNEWRRELETDPQGFKSLTYWKQVAFRRRIGIRIPEEMRMALIFEQVVANPLGDLYGGAGLYLLGRYQDAADRLETGVKSLGRQAAGSILHYYLGLAYQELGRMADAKAAFDAFIRDTPLKENDIRVIEAKKAAESGLAVSAVLN